MKVEVRVEIEVEVAVEIQVQVYPLKLSQAMENIEGLTANHIGSALFCFIDDMDEEEEKPAAKKKAGAKK